MFGTFLPRGATIGSAIGGLIGPTDCQVTASGGSLKVVTSTGELWVPGTNSGTTTQGAYYFRVSAAETSTPAAADATNPRIDAVVARVKDQAYNGAENLGELELAKGTAKSGATLGNLSGGPGQTGGPALAENAYVLAYILIPAKATTITSTEILNVSSLVGGGSSLIYAKYTGNVTLLAGEFAFVELSGAATATLPAPAKGIRVGVFAGVGSTITVNASTNGGKIYGDFVSAANNVTLLALQHIELIGTGTTWVIVAGEPKREQAPTHNALKAKNTKYTPNATRPTLVIVTVVLGANSGGALYCGPSGSLESIASVHSGTGTTFEIPITFICQAGHEWEFQSGEGTSILYASYTTL